MPRSIVVKRPVVGIRDVCFFSQSFSQQFKCIKLLLKIFTINGFDCPCADPFIIFIVPIIIIATTTDDSDNKNCTKTN